MKLDLVEKKRDFRFPFQLRGKVIVLRMICQPHINERANSNPITIKKHRISDNHYM